MKTGYEIEIEKVHKGHPKIDKDILPFDKVFAHGLLFFVQMLIFTQCNAIYHDVFVEANIIKEEEDYLTPLYVGYFSGSYFMGKIISDLFWGWVRDKLGDKSTINVTIICLIVSLLIAGFSWNLLSMVIFVFLIGLSSGIFVPALAFCSWTEIEKRETLVMYMNLFAAAGTMIGPFIGSMLFSVFQYNKMPKTFATIAVINIMALILFNYTFSGYDDKAHIEQSQYSKLLEVETEKVRSSQNNIERVSNNEREDSEKLELDGGPLGIEGPNGLDVSITDNLRFIESRQKLHGMTAYEMIMKSSARLILVLICGITWVVKLLEWILIPTWVEVSVEGGGLGFSSVQTGSISLISFPLTCILLVIFSKRISNFKASGVLHISNLAMLVFLSMFPLIAFINLSKENLLLLIGFISAFKEGSYIVWITSWSALFTKLFPGSTLGRIYSWSFFIGHILLVISSQIYPRLLTFFLESPRINSLFGRYRVLAFFIILAAPLISVNFMIIYARRTLYKKEKLLI